MDIKLKYIKYHNDFANSEEGKKLLSDAQDLILKMDLPMDNETVYMVFLGASYDDFTKKMLTWCAFVNNTGKAINELHGVVRFKYTKKQGVQIATTTIDMNKAFLGKVAKNEGILVNYNIPVKGLTEDCDVRFSDLEGCFDDVRVTYCD